MSLTKLSTTRILPGRPATSGQAYSHTCPPTPPIGGGTGGSGGSGGGAGNCYFLPIVTGHNPDGTAIISGFAEICN